MAARNTKKKQAVKSKSFTGMIRGNTGLVIFAIVFGLVGVYSIVSSSALVGRRGGNSNGATLTVTPNPMKLGYIDLVVAGCGYEPNSNITLNYYPVDAPGATFSLGFAGTETADSSGCISVKPFDGAFTSVPGTYGFKAYKIEFGKNYQKRETLKAQTTFVVEP